MKIWIDRDERWPDHSTSKIDDGYGRMANISKRDYRKWRRAKAKYDHWQTRLAILWVGADNRSVISDHENVMTDHEDVT